MAEGKMNQLHQLVSKGVKDPKKIAKELKLPGTPEVHKAIAGLIKGMKEEKELDPVNRKAVVKKFKDRKDKDIDNDGDVDDSDEYLHKRRKAISKATKDEQSKKKLAAESFTNYDPTPTELDEACEYVLENGSIDHLSDNQLDEVIKTVATAIGKGIGAVAKGTGSLAAKGAKKAADRLSTSGRADAAEKKAAAKEKKNQDRERLARAKERIRAAKEKSKEEKEKTKAQKQRVKDMKNKEAEEKRERQARERDAAAKKESTELDEAMKFWKVTITKKAGKLFKGQNVVTKARNSAEAIKKGIKQMKGNPALVPGGSVTAELDEGAKKESTELGEGIIGDVQKKMATNKLKRLNDQEAKLRKELDKPFFRVNSDQKKKGDAKMTGTDFSNRKDDIRAKIAKVMQAKKKLKDKFPNLRVEATELEEKNDALYLIYKDKIKAQQVRNFIKKQYRTKTEVEYAPMDAKNFGVSVFSDRGQADKIKKVVDKKFGKPDDFMLESV